MTDAAILEVDGLRKAFGRVVVADELTFSVAPGEAVGIVGPNGAGKTSLLNLITGTLRPDGGRVVLDGTSIERLPAHARARLGIGRTYQVPRPFSGMTVFENVVLGSIAAGRLRGRAADEAAVEALARSGLLDRANVLAGSLTLIDGKPRAVMASPSVQAVYLGEGVEV